MVKPLLRVLGTGLTGLIAAGGIAVALAPAAAADDSVRITAVSRAYDTSWECEEVRSKYSVRYRTEPCRSDADPWETPQWRFYYY